MIPVEDVFLTVDGGRRPAKSVVGETFTVWATVFREGHDAVNASVALHDPDGGVTHVPMTCVEPGLDLWSAETSANREGLWSYSVEGWSDPYGTWHHDAVIKVEAGVDTELMLEEGARVLQRALDEVERTPEQARVLHDAIWGLREVQRPPLIRLGAGISPAVEEELARRSLRDMVSLRSPSPGSWSARSPWTGAWYEMFPRSEGAYRDPDTGVWRSGTLRTAMDRLPAIADMGFDVVYLTPIHPIGRTNRKGPNNTLNAGPLDPGSPYAIGSADGGHDAIHPDLGTFEDFDAFVARAKEPRHGGLRHRAAVLPRPPLGDLPTPSGSRRAPTARSPTPRTRPRSIRTSTRSTSTTTRRASTPRCGGSSRCGSTTASRCSGSTTRTPSRSSSGSG